MRHAGGVSTHRTADLGFARLDLDRARRTGTPEVVYAGGKTPEQTVACLAALRDGGPSAAAGQAWGGRRPWTGRRGRRSWPAGPTPSSIPRHAAPVPGSCPRREA